MRKGVGKINDNEMKVLRELRENTQYLIKEIAKNEELDEHEIQKDILKLENEIEGLSVSSRFDDICIGVISARRGTNASQLDVLYAIKYFCDAVAPNGLNDFK